MKKFRSGYVSIIGRPNVGKSTLLNVVLGEKVAIVTPKPQTTRNRLIGVKNLPDAQIVFIDTPGIHKPKHRLGEIMVREARESAKEVDLILFMAEPEEPGRGDMFVIEMLKELDRNAFLLINKIDAVRRQRILPVMDAYSRLFPFKEIIPVSALTGDGIGLLLDSIVKYLPEGPKYYPDDIVTDQLERFMVSEIIREKVMQETGDEIPYSVAVEVTQWSEKRLSGSAEEPVKGEYSAAGDGIVFISANIYVERKGQKGIIIGKNGAKLKTIGTRARLEIESLLGTKVFLELWVKIRKDWRSSENILREMGFK